MAVSVDHPESGGPRLESILRGVKETLCQASGISLSQLDPQASFLELGFDSLLLVQVAQTLEARFKVRISIIQLLEEQSTAILLARWLDSRLDASWVSGPTSVREAARQVSTPEVSASQGVSQPGVSPALSAAGGISGVGGGRSGGGGGSVVERVVAQQMEIMRQQLETLRQLSAGLPKQGSGSTPGPAMLAREAVVPAASPEAGTKTSPTSSGADTFIPPFQPMQLGGRGGFTQAQQDYLEAFIERYCRRTSESKLQTQGFRTYLADARATMGFKLAWKELVYPLIGSRAKGSRIWDLDENEYVDVAMGFGLHPFGHSPEFLLEAFQRQMERSMALGPQSERAGRVAQLICELAGVDRAIFCNSGTEALMGAIRAARTHSRRNRIVVFNGSYHGWADGVLARPIPGDVGHSRPSAPGVDPHSVEDVVVLEYGKPEALVWIRAHASELAAVLVEPVQSRQPHLKPQEFLRELRQITQEQGVVLIFDEMITGFRVHPGGAQAVFGVRADLVTYGKHLGGGMPIGVVAGRREVMDVFDGGSWQFGDDSFPEREKILFTGAFFKHPLTMAAAEVILERIKRSPEILSSLNAKTDALVQSLNQSLEPLKAPFRMVNFGSMFKIHWLSEQPNRGLFFYHLLDRGIFYPVETSTCFLSEMHTEEDVERIRAAYVESAREMGEHGFFFEGRNVDAVRGAGGSGMVAAAERSVLSRAPEVSPGRVAAVESAPGMNVQEGGLPRGKRAPGFSLYFFGNYPAEYAESKYALIQEAVRYADRSGFEAVWLPERHFHSFGGFSPNPSVLAAALAAQTQRIHLRAGSVVIPLHHPIRAAEDWALVDNLSGGRVGISFATGWHPNDFVFAPENFDRRHEITTSHMDLVRRMWRGEAVEVRGGAGNDLKVRLHPQPRQPELPVWISGVSVEAFQAAGKMGVNLLTNLQVMTIPELAERIRVYRESRAAGGHDPDSGRVTVLLHGYVSDTVERARAEAKEAFLRYVKASLEISSGKIVSEGGRADVNAVPESDMRRLLEEGYERYLRENRVLIGTVESCSAVVAQLMEAGVSEIGCLIDFGVEQGLTMRSLAGLDAVRRRCVESMVAPRASSRAERVLPEVFRSLGAVSPDPVQVPLTEGQQGLLALCRMEDEASRAYQESITLHFEGPLDFQALEWAWKYVVTRHDALRTVFSEDGPYQVIQPTVDVEVEVVALPTGDASMVQSRVEAQFRAWESEVLNLTQGPLARARLLRVHESDHYLVVTVHHLISDGHSFGLLVRDLQAAYNHRVQGEPLSASQATSFRHHVEWERSVVKSEDFKTAEAYWESRFASGLPVLELPGDRVRAPRFSHRGHRVSARLEGAAVRAVRQAGGKQGCTLFVTLLAGFQTLLHRLSSQEEVVVGITSSPPALNADNDVFGYRVQLVPVVSRIPVGAADSVAEFLRCQRTTVLEGIRHQPYFFGRLLAKHPEFRDGSRPSLFSVTFNLDREWPEFGFSGLQVSGDARSSRNPRDTTRFELNLNVLEQRDGSLHLELDYSADLFEEETVRRWLEYYLVMVQGLGEPERMSGSWKALPWIPSRELERLLGEWNRTGQVFSGATTLHGGFEEAVERNPDQLAMVSGSDEWTYRGLNERANQLAGLLVRRGVQRGDLVLVCLPRSAWAVVAMLAVMKAGAAYVPMDMEDPRGRFEMLLEDTKSRVVITDTESAREMAECGADLLCVDALVDELNQLPRSSPGLEVGAEELAYVMYTSGSTGQPKGAMVPHRAIVNEMRWMQRKYPLTPKDAVLQKSSFGFDASVWEIYTALLAGATLVLTGPMDHRDPQALIEKIQRHQVTTMIVVPSFLDSFLAEPAFSRCASLRRVFCGGEAVPADLVAKFHRALSGPTLHNLYGPTECAIASTSWDFVRGREEDSIPIGLPVDNACCHVVGLGGNLQPVGVPGELWISGAGVGSGYWRRDDLTRQKFGVDPFVGGAAVPMYRTGDRVIRRGDGAIVFLGRTDHQIKLRGYRIEPGEIEEALRAHPWVRDAVVVVKTDWTGQQRLVSYVSFLEGQFNHEPQWSNRDLGDLIRQHLRQTLPEYMVPALMVTMPTLPVLPSGKVQRQALPEPEWNVSRDEHSVVAPRTPLESTLCELWGRVLGLARVGVRDNIFDLGGDSLLISKISLEGRRSGLRLTPKLVFENQTIEALAKVMEDRAPQRETARESELRRRVAELTPEEVARMLAERKQKLAGPRPPSSS